MALPQNTYVGNGSTVLYSFTFPYIRQSDVKVSLNSVDTTQFTFSNATTLQLNTAPANGVAIRIYRSTFNDELAATFYPGSAIRAQDLNENFVQTLYAVQESTFDADSATTLVAGAVSTSNTALTTANSAATSAASAVSSANSAVSAANSAVSTANTASTSASNAVSSSTTAVTTANTALSTANTALSNSNTATTTANSATSTANTALSNSNNAVSVSNTANSNASAAVSTANTASANASAAVTTANTASTTANSATSTANTANTKADAAIAAVASSVNYTPVANVASIPSSPANNTYIEIANSTGVESFTPLAGLPSGFIGDSGLSVRLNYTTSTSSWNWLNYYANNAETRYLKQAGGTLTGALTLAGAPATGLQPATKSYVDAADSTLTTAAAAAQTTANTAVTNAATAQTTANTAVTNSAAAQTTADAALPKAGGTLTGSVTFAGTQPTGTTTTAGIVQLTDSTSSTSTTTAATPNSVKGAYDFTTIVSTTANAALPKAGGLMTGALGVVAGSAAAPSAYFTGDTNTGIYSPSADQVAISTNGAGRLFIDASGNVGVGTNDTANAFVTVTKQDVSLRLNPVTGAASITAVQTGVAFRDLTIASNATIFQTASTERLRITAAGLVGIGTSSPNYQLHATTSFAVGAAGFNQQLSFTNDTIQSLVLGTGYTALKLNPLGGNVGIGTTSPGGTLDVGAVAGAVTAGDLTVTTGSTTAKVTIGRLSSTGNDSTSFRIRDRVDRDVLTVDAGNLVYSQVGTERARIDSSGRLLVGTSSSAGQGVNLQVEGLSFSDSGIQARRNSADTSASSLILMKSRGTTRGSVTSIASGDSLGQIVFFGADGTNDVQAASIIAQVDGTPGANDMPGRLVFSTTADGASSPAERMRITSASNTTIKIVGINSTDTGGFNFVNSSQVIYWNIATNNNTFYIADSDFTNFAYLPQNPTSWLFASDERLKENIAELEYGIDAVKQLQPRRFNFVGNDKSTIGFIAQELKNVVPEAVSGEEVPYEETDTPQQKASKSLGVGKETLVPVLVKALQEAIAKIEVLEAKVATLEAA